MKFFYWLFILVLIILMAAPSVWAFDSSSGSFYMRQKTQGISGSRTSSSFKLTDAGGQVANYLSTSSTFQGLSGILKILFRSIKPDYTQVHYHWRNDDGSETTATSATAGSQDTLLDPLVEQTPARLRLAISNEGGTVLAYSVQQFRLEYGLLSTTCGAISTWVDVGGVGGDWDMFDSANLTDGNNTTNISVSVGGVGNENANFISANGGIKDTSSQTSAVSVASDSFIELEYSIKPLSAATDYGTYCFRVTNAGTATNYTYTQYAQARVTPEPSISYSLSTNTLDLGALTPASVTSNNHTVTVTTNASSGYILYVYEDGNLRKGADDINDVLDGAVTAGAEEYGLNTGYNDFTSDSAITSSLKIARQTNTAVSSEVTTCTYKASVSSMTPSGAYSQIVTWVVVGRF